MSRLGDRASSVPALSCEAVARGNAAHAGAEAAAAQGLPVSWLACPLGTPAGRFHACVGGRQAAGCVWECSFDGASPVTCASAIAGAGATTVVAASGSGRYRLLGSADGFVRVEETHGAGRCGTGAGGRGCVGVLRPRLCRCPVAVESAAAAGSSPLLARLPGVPSQPLKRVPRAPSGFFSLNARPHVSLYPRCWQERLHDMQHGALCGVAAAFDDSLLISAARDGSLLITRNGLVASSAPSVPAALAAALPAVEAVGAVRDIGPDALTFEESKQAAAANAVAARAAEARQQLAAEFGALRGELQELLAANAASAPAHRLPRGAFTLDPGELGLRRAARGVHAAGRMRACAPAACG
jgi:hypothetical protein